MAFNWGEILKIAVPAAISGTGAILSNRSQNQQNQALQGRTEEMDRLAREQMQRQQAYSNIVLPSLLQALGRKDPALLKQVEAGGGNPPGAIGTAMNPEVIPRRGGLAQPGSGSAGVLGDTAMGFTLGGPIGATVGAASNLFGQGRRAADAWTKTTQNDFGQQMSGIIDPYSQAKAAGSLTPEATTKAQEDFRRLLAEYTASANQYAGQGKSQKKVIDQMWSQFSQPGYIPSWKSTLGIT